MGGKHGFGAFGLGSGSGAGSGSDKLTGGSKSANKANLKNLADIKALFAGLNQYGDQKYGEAMKSIEGVGNASKANALSQENQYLAKSSQSLGGLYNSTVKNSAARGIHSDTLRVLGGIDEDMARMRAGLLTGQAGFRQSNVGNLASILGGVQNNPGTNYLAEIMKMAPFLSDRRVKDIIRRVDIVSGPDGVPFGLYHFKYRQYPEAGVFEGVIAQEVTHLPGVVVQGIFGLLLVDTDALRKQTGIEVKHLGAEVVS
jgi:hypothetical protein